MSYEKPRFGRQLSFTSLEEEQKSHMIKVHGVVGLGLALAAYGARLHVRADAAGDTNTWLQGSDTTTIVQAVCVALLGVGEATGRRQQKGISAWRFVVYLVCALAAGLNVGTWVLKAAQESGLCRGTGWGGIPDLDLFDLFSNQNKCQLFEEVLFSSLLLTAGTYGCFFLAAMLAPTGSAQIFAPMVTCGTFLLSMTYWASRAFGWMGTDGFEILYVQVGLAVYCVKVYVDTQDIYYRVANKGERDVISHALVIFFNILHLFIRIITIIAKVMAANAEAEKNKKRHKSY